MLLPYSASLQATLGHDHPLGAAVVTEAAVEDALIRVTAIEVGQPCGARLFALPRNHTASDRVSCIHVTVTAVGCDVDVCLYISL